MIFKLVCTPNGESMARAESHSCISEGWGILLENYEFQYFKLFKAYFLHSAFVGWLFWVKRPFKTVFQSISGRLPKRGRGRRERIEESKNVQTTPTAPTASAIGPCPTIIKIVGPLGTGSLPRTIAPPDHPLTFCKCIWGLMGGSSMLSL